MLITALIASPHQALGEFDWIVIGSTALGHPRWSVTFGGEPPLVLAARGLADQALDASLAQLAQLASRPVTACLLAFEVG